tara:strand:- start:114 stop:581 length:468 start_codon:yes stop_codon:yes gene_type:complete
MNYDDMAHMADQERKREREEFKEENNPTITVPLKQWREVNAEIVRLREALEQANMHEDCPREINDIIDEALKGASDGRGDEDNPDGDVNGDSNNPNHHTEKVGCDSSPAPLKPLELEHPYHKMNCSHRNAEHIEQWSAEVSRRIDALEKRGAIHE